MNEQYGLLKVEYKLYHPNILRIDILIKHYQKNHYDFDVVKPKTHIDKKEKQIYSQEMNRYDVYV